MARPGRPDPKNPRPLKDDPPDDLQKIGHGDQIADIAHPGRHRGQRQNKARKQDRAVGLLGDDHLGSLQLIIRDRRGPRPDPQTYDQKTRRRKKQGQGYCPGSTKQKDNA